MTVTLPTPRLTSRRVTERRRSRLVPARRAELPSWALPLAALLVAGVGLALTRWPRLEMLSAMTALVILAFVLLRERASRLRAEREARTDSLTGLTNRRGLNEALDRALSADPAEPLGLLLLDLDHFKRINDRFGHLMGDHVLQEAARALQEALRGQDVKGRWGGEEFVVLLPGADAEVARRIAERLRHHLEGRLQLGMVAVTTSVGVTARVPGDTAERLLARADGALYAAKRAGRNRTVLAGDPESDGEPTRLAACH